MCVIEPNFMQIGQVIAKIYPFIYFSRWPPCAILDLQNLEILTAHTPQELMCVTTPNLVQIGQAAAEIWPFFDFSNGGRPPSCIRYTRVWTTHEEYLVVFVTVQHLV